MSEGTRRRMRFCACVATLSAVLAMLSMWAFATPHRPLEYMVAGTLATAIALLGIFLWLTRRGAHKGGEACAPSHPAE